MPLYEYACDACGNRFERIQKFSDPPVETCPKCEGRVRKLLSSPAIQFKGSGWYITDYARKGGAAGGGGEKKSEGEGADKTEKSDKPAGSSTDSSAASTPSSSAPAKTE
jgi:putative FmdB family regulatory protein